MARAQKIEREVMSIRLPIELANKLDEFSQRYQTTKSAVITSALENIFNSKECVQCGALNPEDASVCYKCGTPLYSDNEINQALELLCSTRIFEVRGLFQEPVWKKYLDAHLEPHFLPQITRKLGEPAEYTVQIRFRTPEGVEVLPVEESTVRKLKLETLLTKLQFVRNHPKEEQQNNTTKKS